MSTSFSFSKEMFHVDRSKKKIMTGIINCEGENYEVENDLF